jgi:5-methyltetrahydropteroyltriglutamate--homocysteine methyltransferase
MVAPSYSLLHVPVESAPEDRLDPDIKEWLAFATEKLSEVAALARGLDEGESAIELKLAKSDNAVGSP